MRRTLIITGIVVVIIGVGVAIYFLFFAKPAITVPDTTLPSAGQGTLPSGSASDATAPQSGPKAVTARLVKISAGPVVPGEAVVDKRGSTASSSPEVVVNYIERQSGNVFIYSETTRTLTRVSNKTLPGIQSAAWLSDGSAALVRYLSGADSSTINTYALFATSSDGFFLSQNLTDVAVSSTNILTLASGVNGSVASLSNKDGSHSVSIFTSPLSALRLSYAGKDHYLAFTKPSNALAGGAFLVDTAGNFSRVGGAHNGLVALASPSGKWVLISSARGGTMQLELVDTTTSESIALPVATIADKCVWATDDSAIYCGVPTTSPAGAVYPDDWYQGAVHFSDRIWKIQVAGRYAQLVLDFPKEAKDVLDAWALALDPSETTLVFVNKNDGSLWSYSL